MADVVDMAVDLQDEHLARSLARARAPIAAGVAGECEQCFEDSPRLVGGRCAFCRDGRQRPDTTAAATPAPKSKPIRETMMPAKSVQLPASATAAITRLEAHARDNDLPLGQAAAELIERGAATITAAPASTPAPLPIDALLQMIRARFDDRPDHAPALQSAEARAVAAEQRADDAEARASAAERKLAALREALAA